MGKLLVVVAVVPALIAAAAASWAHAQGGAAPVARTTIVYGNPVTLTGFLPDAEGPEPVTILARAHGSDCFCPVARIMSNEEGAFVFTAKPSISTEYQVSRRGVATAALRVDVRPRLTFAIVSAQRGIFLAKAEARRPLAGKMLYLQRRARGRWVVVKRVRLGRGAVARFHAELPVGSWELRLFMPKDQAGPGYVAGFS